VNKNPFNDLHRILNNEMQSVDLLINERMFSEHAPLIHELTNHLINAGGKRLRPLLTLASAKMCGYSGQHHIHLAAIVELIHTATLLHDDVIDESLQRRGKPTANMLWDNKSSVLVGDYLFARAFQLMVEVESIGVLNSLSSASAKISESEVLQMSLAKNLAATSSQYFQVINGKTATLFSSACEVGGLISNTNPNQVKALSLYGEALGISFQIVDDFLDYAGLDSDLGKNIGDDFREQKITLPIIRSLENKHSKNLAFWERTLAKGKQKEDDFKTAQKILSADGSLEKVRLEAMKWADLAKSQLKLLPVCDIKTSLCDLTDFVISRVT
jgi:octaprenyl-diphosphate synthase